MYADTYAKLDQPEMLQLLFHPRRAPAGTPPAGALDRDIPVGEGIAVHARFHRAGSDDPVILMFHGNGEVVGDYDEVGSRFAAHGVNFLVVDYRGYGRSGGTPTVTAMLRDAHRILKEVRIWLSEEGCTGTLLVMGRSLGSASALELASDPEAGIAGLIIESGFALTLPLLLRLGIDIVAHGLTEEDGFKNVQKIAYVTKPTFIVHAQHDSLIPLADAEILQAQCGARSKEFQMVPGADHNTILEVAGDLYYSTLKRFAARLAGRRVRSASGRGAHRAS